MRLESQHPGRIRYLVVLTYRQEASNSHEESCLLGVDCQTEVTTIGLVLPVWADTRISLDGDGGFTVATSCRQHIFKPISVQAMWSSLQTLHKASSEAQAGRLFEGCGSACLWVQWYSLRISSDRSCLNEWIAMDGLTSKRPPSPDLLAEPCQQRQTKDLIRSKLKEIMTSVDLDEVTSKLIRTRLESETCRNLSEYKSYIDEEMLKILGQMDTATQIFDYLYLGSEWNASNFEELKHKGVEKILNVTREIDSESAECLRACLTQRRRLLSWSLRLLQRARVRRRLDGDAEALGQDVQVHLEGHGGGLQGPGPLQDGHQVSTAAAAALRRFTLRSSQSLGLRRDCVRDEGQELESAQGAGLCQEQANVHQAERKLPEATGSVSGYFERKVGDSRCQVMPLLTRLPSTDANSKQRHNILWRSKSETNFNSCSSSTSESPRPRPTDERDSTSPHFKSSVSLTDQAVASDQWSRWGPFSDSVLSRPKSWSAGHARRSLLFGEELSPPPTPKRKSSRQRFGTDPSCYLIYQAREKRAQEDDEKTEEAAENVSPEENRASPQRLPRVHSVKERISELEGQPKRKRSSTQAVKINSRAGLVLNLANQFESATFYSSRCSPSGRNANGRYTNFSVRRQTRTSLLSSSPYDLRSSTVRDPNTSRNWSLLILTSCSMSRLKAETRAISTRGRRRKENELGIVGDVFAVS